MPRELQIDETLKMPLCLLIANEAAPNFDFDKYTLLLHFLTLRTAPQLGRAVSPCARPLQKTDSVARVAMLPLLVACAVSASAATGTVSAGASGSSGGGGGGSSGGSASGGSSASGAAVPFRFSNVHGDSMILQMAPQRAQVWGFCTSGDHVTVTLAGTDASTRTVAANSSVYLGNTTWSALLPPTENSLTGKVSYSITATSKLTGATSTIKDVLFGDVHFCSGQVRARSEPLPSGLTRQLGVQHDATAYTSARRAIWIRQYRI
jgi:hypothetical protein